MNQQYYISQEHSRHNDILTIAWNIKTLQDKYDINPIFFIKIIIVINNESQDSVWLPVTLP